MIGTFLMICSANAQVKNPEPLNRMVNSTLMHQVLNDFDRSIPIVLFAPGFFFIGNTHYNSNPLFSESDYYENEELVRTSNYYQKEIFEVLNSGFISYIPADSIMQVQVIEGNVLLFELKFIRKGDTVVFMQSDAERNKSKMVSFADNKIISVSFYDAQEQINYNSQLIGDTLRISEMIDENTDNITKSLMRFQNGFLSEVSHYRKVSGNFELKSTDQYYQNENNKPALKQTLNRKGKITDSTHYYYDGDKLIHYQSFSGKNEKLSISYMYNRSGKLSGKTVQSQIRNYSNDYAYANGLIADLEIDDKVKTFKRHYAFKSDINKRLASIEYNTISKESLVENLKTRWAFGYNAKGNINSIKVMDDKGVINKEVKLEYNFFDVAD
jgi:hypothetical protein